MSEARFPIEVWIVMNQAGEYVVASDEGTASDLAEDEWGEDGERRYVKLETKLAPTNDNVVSCQTFVIEIEPP
jgi:hypothetical protein